MQKRIVNDPLPFTSKKHASINYQHLRSSTSTGRISTCRPVIIPETQNDGKYGRIANPSPVCVTAGSLTPYE